MKVLFVNTCFSFLIPKKTANLHYRSLRDLYREPHRHYHNWLHIKHMVYELLSINVCSGKEALIIQKVNLPCLWLAIFYHDAIYVPGAEDNEQCSAKLALRTIPDDYYDQESIETIERYIMATTHLDQLIGNDPGCQLIADLDLAIFGATDFTYATYEYNIGLEYKHFPREDYLRGRLKVLKGFVSKEIYHTEFFKKKYEEKAKANLNQSIQKIEEELANGS